MYSLGTRETASCRGKRAGEIQVESSNRGNIYISKESHCRNTNEYGEREREKVFCTVRKGAGMVVVMAAGASREGKLRESKDSRRRILWV